MGHFSEMNVMKKVQQNSTINLAELNETSSF